jgi:DME family drug/metabolite transporter
MLVGLLLVAVAAISWGTTGATMTLLARESGTSPLVVGWARLAVAAPPLVAAAWLRRTAADPRWRAADLAACAVAGAAMAAYQLCYFRAVTLTGVAVTALLAICSAPLLIAVLAALWLGERPGARAAIALAMGVGGTALLVLDVRGGNAAGARSSLGALLALGAGLSYAVYAVAAKRVLDRVTPIAQAAATFGLAALLLLPFLLGERAVGAQLATGWPLLVYLGLGPTALAYALFTTGLRRVPASAAGLVSLLEPLTATALGVLAFGEAFGLAGASGAALLLGSFALLVRAARREVPA